MSKHLFPYRWKLSDGYPAGGIAYHGRKVFGTFICGGGSTMGYKLAGYDHLGGVEIDPKVAAVYVPVGGAMRARWPTWVGAAMPIR